MFYHADTLTAGLLMVWLILVMLSDNFLKPILLGRGAPVPMLVIFLGSIGGFIPMGFIDLFIGAVILSLGFKLFQAWLKIKRKVVKLLGCFSRSLIVWIVGIVTILILSLLWIRSSNLNEVLLLE